MNCYLISGTCDGRISYLKRLFPSGILTWDEDINNANIFTSLEKVQEALDDEGFHVCHEDCCPRIFWDLTRVTGNEEKTAKIEVLKLSPTPIQSEDYVIAPKMTSVRAKG